MTFTLQADSLGTSGESLLRWAESLRVPVQQEMAARLQDITQNNFGLDGEDRPSEWQPLSIGYARTAHGGDTTPKEILSGDMLDSIRVEDTSPEFARVFTDMDYAATQQWGGGEWNTPARPFFPLFGSEDSPELTPYSEAEVWTAAREEVDRQTRK